MAITDADRDTLIQHLKGIRRIVINDCYGGFGLSDYGRELYCQYACIQDEDFADYQIDRDDPYLIRVVEELGEAAADKYSQLKIVEIPADVDWQIDEYDGHEWVAEKHRTWS